MITADIETRKRAVLNALPDDRVRRILWRFTDRKDLQEVVLSTRAAARGPVARAVADGARHTDEWTDAKAALLPVYDDAGITSLFMGKEYGGYMDGPKNLAQALVALELAWVDGGAATCAMAGNLALAPIHERGTEEQRRFYMSGAIPTKAGEDRVQLRGAFALTEPLPYVGVNTRAMSGKVRVARWEEGKEPTLRVTKRGRFITNMAYANFVSTAVETADERIKTSCMIILHEGDPGVYERGRPTGKLVHRLSSTTDPEFDLEVPASRIIGGYTIKDGILIPNFTHSQIIAAVFRRTRVTVGLMTSGKLLSAVEPIIRYQRDRFRGGETLKPGTPLHDMGLQQKEDSLHRLVDIWATGEASASLGLATARFFDDFDALERLRDGIMEQQGVRTPRAQMKALKEREKSAIEYVELTARPEENRDDARIAELETDPLVQFVAREALANVLCPATKLWNTGVGVNMLREAVSLMGGAGITEDCPGFLAYKWMDSQLEATYEGPEAVQRRQLALTMTSEVFLAQFRLWIAELRGIAARRPGIGACTIASAMELWLWTLRHLLDAKDADGKPLYQERRQGVTFPMADALSWLVASRQQILDVQELERVGPADESLADELPATLSFLTDLCHVQASRSASEVARVCSDLVFGYNEHPSWEADAASCFQGEDLDAMEAIMPGIAACTRGLVDVVESDGTHAAKAGPCVRFAGMEAFTRLRSRLDGCLTGARMAKDRAAFALTKVKIPEALDYPPA